MEVAPYAEHVFWGYRAGLWLWPLIVSKLAHSKNVYKFSDNSRISSLLL